MRTNREQINQSLERQIIKTLAQSLSDLKDGNEALVFLKDFFTPAELKIFAKRLAVGYWLKKGRSYHNIQNNLKVSSATVAEISSRLSSEGFKLVLKKIEAEEWANIWIQRIKKFVKI